LTSLPTPYVTYIMGMPQLKLSHVTISARLVFVSCAQVFTLQHLFGSRE